MDQEDLEKMRKEYFQQTRVEMFRAMVLTGQAAIKSAFLLNGVTAFALLAFVAHNLALINSEVAMKFSLCALVFGSGTLAAAMAAGSIYFAQCYFASLNERIAKMGNFLNAVGIFCMLTSYVMFLSGLYVTSLVLTAILKG